MRAQFVCVGVVLAAAGGVVAQCEPMETSPLAPSEVVLGDDFGLSVSISGDVIMIGARRALVDEVVTGAAFVYRLDEEAWVEEAKLSAPDGMSLDQFGQSLVVSGATAAIGAPGAGDGAVYIFEDDGEDWLFVETLPVTLGSGDLFGASVAMSGDRLVVGATRDDEAGMDAGAAYVFERIEGVWTEQVKLTGAAAGDGFGLVDIDGDVIVVGAPGASDGAGAVSVYRFDGAAWMLEDVLAPKSLEAGDEFSRASVSGDVIVVGAPGGDFAVPYRWDGASWVADPALTALDGESGDRFGNSVETSGGLIFVGANLDDDNGGSSGSAYVFRDDEGVWVEDGKLLASDGAPSDLFGGIRDSIVYEAGTAVIGAPSNGGGFGGAYVFDVNCFCAADINGDGQLSVLDFVAFQLAFQAEEKIADCDGNGVWNVLDFVCYQKVFQAGCL